MFIVDVKEIKAVVTELQTKLVEIVNRVTVFEEENMELRNPTSRLEEENAEIRYRLQEMSGIREKVIR